MPGISHTGDGHEKGSGSPTPEEFFATPIQNGPFILGLGWVMESMEHGKVGAPKLTVNVSGEGIRVPVYSFEERTLLDIDPLPFSDEQGLRAYLTDPPDHGKLVEGRVVISVGNFLRDPFGTLLLTLPVNFDLPATASFWLPGNALGEFGFLSEFSSKRLSIYSRPVSREETAGFNS